MMFLANLSFETSTVALLFSIAIWIAVVAISLTAMYRSFIAGLSSSSSPCELALSLWFCLC